MPRVEEKVLDELPEHLLIERRNLEMFHRETAEEPYHEFLVNFPLQASYLNGIESLEVAVARQSCLSQKQAWSKAPKTKFGYTTLHEVARAGDLKTLKYISDSNQVDMNSRSRSGRTALHYAILMGKDDVISFLLSAKADVSIVDKTGCNALHLAAAQNRETLAKDLLSLGLDFSKKNGAGHRPLEIMALNVLGYKTTNLYKHFIKLIIKKQTAIVEKWLNDLYSCGIFEMEISPREMSGAQLLDLQEKNSELFVAKWNALKEMMDPEFRSTGRSTMPGEGFRDERPSTLVNGRYLELWSKYYESLKLGCKPSILCKFSKKTEPDSVHLKYEIRGIKKGKYDPEFIDVGMMVVNLKNDLLLKEMVDPDTSIEQPMRIKPATSEKQARQQGAKQLSIKTSRIENADDISGDSDSCQILGEYLISQEIRFMIDIIGVVHAMIDIICEGRKAVGIISGVSSSIKELDILWHNEQSKDIATHQKVERIRLEGPIIDLRSFPWETTTEVEITNRTKMELIDRADSDTLNESQNYITKETEKGRVYSQSDTYSGAKIITKVPSLNLEFTENLRK